MSAQGIRLSTSARADTSHQLVTRLDRLPVDTITNDVARGYVPGAVPFGSFGERELVGSTQIKSYGPTVRFLRRIQQEYKFP